MLNKRSKKQLLVALLTAGLMPVSQASQAQAVSCDMVQYKAAPGLLAQDAPQGVLVTWAGESENEVRLQLAVTNGTPTIEELALRKGQGAWVSVVTKVTPEFSVTTGLRRISNQQLEPMVGLGMAMNKENVSKFRWEPFWDAPLDLSPPSEGGAFANAKPPTKGLSVAGQPGLPRDPAEIQRAKTVFHVGSCRVASDGARLTVEFPGVDLGVFSGLLRFTVFQGTNLIRQEIVARTAKEWVAYKYDAGLKGLAITDASRVMWRDTANMPHEDRLRAGINKGPVALTAANRLVAVQQPGGSIAAFPPPHKFFWSREAAVNLGYNWFRKDTATSYSFGIRQSEHEDFAHPIFQGNWALYSARPGTDQLMTMFLYPTLGNAGEAIERGLAFTHADRYKPLAGFQVMNHHYHMDMGERLLREGGPDTKLPDLIALKAMGLNIVSPVDSISLTGFNDAGEVVTPQDPEQMLKRRSEQNKRSLERMAMSAKASKAHSDDTFLVLPSQEIFRGPLGGHVDLIFSRPVLWDERMPGESFKDTTPSGTVYHLSGADDLMQMARTENILISMPHPRSKGSTGFPDAIKDRKYFNDPQYHGFGARWGMGIDGSEKRLCEYRCWPLLDDLSNWAIQNNAPLKRIVSISEAMAVSPADDIYGSTPVTYLKLDKLPQADDVTPVIEAMKTGYMFWSTGEVLVPSFEIQGRGRDAKLVADVQWTFPLDFVEVIWGDGKATGRQIVSTTQFGAFGANRFEIPFDARGKRWVRFAAWDSASNGAVVQPLQLPR